MILRQRGIVRVVAGACSYVIEPARFDLGLTRVEMLDRHLHNVSTGSRDLTVLNELLEARAELADADAEDPTLVEDNA